MVLYIHRSGYVLSAQRYPVPAEKAAASGSETL